MADDEIALALVLVNFVSALWSYFCISASLDRRSRIYDLVHDTELAWHAFWTSCQTFALLVSFTNLALLTYIAYRLSPGYIESVKAQQAWSQRVILSFLGVVAVAILVMISFLPYKLTLIETGRLDENIFIHWDG